MVDLKSTLFRFGRAKKKPGLNSEMEVFGRHVQGKKWEESSVDSQLGKITFSSRNVITTLFWSKKDKESKTEKCLSFYTLYQCHLTVFDETT